MLITSLCSSTGASFGQYPEQLPNPDATLYTDKQNYQYNDTITISGDVNKDEFKSFPWLDVEIRDPNGDIFKDDTISINSTGHYTYKIGISPTFVSGQYIVRVSNWNYGVDLGNSFHVDLGNHVTSENDLGDGNVFNMQAKNMGVPGDIMEINGNLVTKDPIKIILSDPNGMIVNSATSFSDRNGDFTSELKMPGDATPGTWRIIGTSGIYHKELNFTIIDNSVITTCYAGDLCSGSSLVHNSTYPAEYTNETNSKIFQSPLNQLRSGIAAQDVQCNYNMKIIIKKSDGSPACVKPESVSKLLIRGWAMLSLKNFGANLTGHRPASLTNISENDCEQFHTISVKPHNGTIVPVLLMYSNSTGCARFTYTINYDYNNTSNGRIAWPEVANFSLLHIDTLKYTSNGDSFGVSTGKDFTNSFEITTVPETVNLANFPIGSNFTITYIIRPLPNATGFYDESLPEPVCLAYPLAVNYNADQVNSSDFSKGLISMQNHSCFSMPYELSGVEISGMSYKEMTLP